MKLPPVVFATVAFLLAGCASDTGNASASRSANSPAGTDVGTSNPTVNQPTTTTRTGRANSATDDVPNSRR